MQLVKDTINLFLWLHIYDIFFLCFFENNLPFIASAQSVEVVLALWFIHRLSWSFPAIGNIKTFLEIATK